MRQKLQLHGINTTLQTANGAKRRRKNRLKQILRFILMSNIIWYVNELSFLHMFWFHNWMQNGILKRIKEKEDERDVLERQISDVNVAHLDEREKKMV